MFEDDRLDHLRLCGQARNSIRAFRAIASAVCAIMPVVALAGPNAGGVILLHVNESLVYTDDDVSYCDASGLAICEEADIRTESLEPMVVSALAAFPGDNMPEVLGLSFGIDFESSNLEVVSFGHCADGEGATTPGWPGPGEGTAVQWQQVQTDQLLEFYWFAVDRSGDEPSILYLRPHPVIGGQFLGPPPTDPLDPIVDYGALGFGTDGYLPCPDGPVPVEELSWGTVKAEFR